MSNTDWPPARIASLRARLSVTQREFAELLGYSTAQTVSDIEGDRQTPSTSVCILLSLIDEFDGLPVRETA